MSDSDSASDSDISQGWTVVGPDGVVDSSSDPDSDIVILKDEEEITDQAAREPGCDELGNQNSDELDMQSREPTCQVTMLNVEPRIDRNMEPDQEAEILSMESELESVTASTEPDGGAKSLSMEPETSGCIEPERTVAATLEPACKPENVTREQGDECDTGIKEEEKLVDYDLFSKDASSRDTGLANDDIVAEATEALEPSVEWISSLEVKEAKMKLEPVAETSNSMEPVFLSTSCHLPLHNFLASSAEKQNSQTEEVRLSSLQNNDNGSDADASNDETDNDDSDDDDDDDESVVRKFHEATFHLNQRPGDRIENQQNNEEDEVLPPDVDDRCESDISGVADDDDSDLSSAGIDDLQLNVGQVVRTYRHQPNPKFNSRLNLLAATTMLLVLGIGIGHYIGTTRGSSFHQQQILRLKTLQDEYFVCLRDTEKLESKLAKAMDSSPNEKLAAVTAVWRRKYEELVLERAELEYRLSQVQESIKLKEEPEQEHKQTIMEEQHEPQHGLEELKQQPGEEKKQEPEKELAKEQEEREHRHITETDLTVTEEPHNSSVENSSTSLHSEGVQCCHQIIELATDMNKKNLEMDQLRNDANQLVVENSELKAAILSQRYSEHPGNSGTGTTEGEDMIGKGFNKQQGDKSLKDGSHAARGHGPPSVRFPEHLTHQQEQNMAEGHDRSKLEISVGAYSQQKARDIVPQPIIVSVLQFFVSSADNNSEPGLLDNRSLGALMNCFTTLENISLDHSFSDLLLHKTWSELEELVRKIDLASVANQWELVLRACHEFIDIETLQNYSFANEDSGSLAQNETSQQVNKLREMVKKLDGAVQGTVKSMQKLSKEPESPRARQKAKNAVENWSRKMLSEWRKFNKSMFQIQGKEVFSDSKKKKNERLEDFVKSAKNRGTLDQSSVGEKSKQAFERNRDHKQTESSSSHQKYEEFWKWNHFDPDDFLQEGFFEDNQREWHKHQKRLRKISGRIQRLTEEILLSMDDDDVEDIYEDVEDFIEDMEDREIPEQLRTWLTCQARWWRCRVQRKHRNEDLVKGCGQQLMHWQLRVLCKEGSQRGPRNRKRSKLCEAVISSQGGAMERDKRNEQKQGMKRNNIGFGSNKVSSRAGRSAGKLLQYSAPNKAQNVNPRVKYDLKKVTYGRRFDSAVDNKAEKYSRDAFMSKNLTFADHGAYDDDLGPSFFPWSQRCSRSAENRYDGNLAEGRHYLEWLRGPFFHQPDNRGKTQLTSFHGNKDQHGSYDQDRRMPSCRGKEEFNSFYLVKGQQYCKK